METVCFPSIFIHGIGCIDLVYQHLATQRNGQFLLKNNSVLIGNLFNYPKLILNNSWTRHIY